jgi:hypothetical protein
MRRRSSRIGRHRHQPAIDSAYPRRARRDGGRAGRVGRLPSGSDRSHRGPVRQAALVAGGAGWRPDPAVLPRAGRPRPRARPGRSSWALRVTAEDVQRLCALLDPDRSPGRLTSSAAWEPRPSPACSHRSCVPCGCRDSRRMQDPCSSPRSRPSSGGRPPPPGRSTTLCDPWLNATQSLAVAHATARALAGPGPGPTERLSPLPSWRRSRHRQPIQDEAFARTRTAPLRAVAGASEINPWPTPRQAASRDPRQVGVWR